MKIRLAFSLLALVVLSACTPADQQYCQSFGVEGTSEYGKCLDYYHRQEAAFDSDLAVCAMRADETYPPTLYDTGRVEHVHGGFGYGGRYYGGHSVHIPPDYYHNQQVDALRMRIIEPCMQARGWNSGSTWQAGRHAVTPAKKRTSQKLPWQR